MEFSRQAYWSRLSFLSPGDLPDSEIEPGSPALQADSLPSELSGKPIERLCALVTSHSLRKEAYLGKIVCPCYWFLSESVYDLCPEKSISKAHLFITQKASPCLITLLSPGLAMNSSQLVSKIKSTLNKWGLASSNTFARDVLQLWGRKGLNPGRHHQWYTVLHGSCFKAGSIHQDVEVLACLFFKNQPGYLRITPGRSQLVWHIRLAQEASARVRKPERKQGVLLTGDPPLSAHLAEGQADESSTAHLALDLTRGTKSQRAFSGGNSIAPRLGRL